MSRASVRITVRFVSRPFATAMKRFMGELWQMLTRCTACPVYCTALCIDGRASAAQVSAEVYSLQRQPTGLNCHWRRRRSDNSSRRDQLVALRVCLAVST